MNNRIKIIIVLIPFILLLFLQGCSSKKNETKEKKPNIVLVLADDLGVPQLGCYGSNYYQTPNIDNLAKEGMKFTNAYAAAAVCSPTRASIVTGKYPARLHLTNFLVGNSKKSDPLILPDWQRFLPLEELTIAEVLKAEGYNTAWFGKWHLSKSKKPPESLGYNPDKQGFDESFITYKPAKGNPLGNWQIPEMDAHNVDTITARSINFIERNVNNPFFLVISHNSIHDPLMEKETSIARFRGLATSEKEENNPVIAAMIERLDSSVGRVLASISELKLVNNTMVIFYSDNGAKDAYAKQTPLRKGKGWLYEGGIRVPLIIKWKGIILANSTTDQIVSSIDFFPTFAELTSSPINPKLTLDGISIYPLLTGNRTIDRKTLYWNYPHYHGGSGMKPACAIRSGNYKLIEWYEAKLLGGQNVYELYNLTNDPGEENDLSSDFPEKVNELKQMLDTWKTNVNAQEPIKNHNYLQQ